jgi:quercetin dioxygenase-like cupin family protein
MVIASVISDVKNKLNESDHPVALSLHKSPDFKVLVMGFKKDMILKDHKTSKSAKLTVLIGKVIFSTETESVDLYADQTLDIPINVMHRVTALEDSICLLSQG